MRSLWLASAATLFIAGAACAQTSQTGPAPTGAPNAATTTAPGASPGNMGSNTAPGSMSVPPAAMSNSGGPAVNASGAPKGPVVAQPGVSPGKTMSPGASSMDGTGMSSKPMMSTSTTTVTHHHYMSGMGMGMMPADASTDTYLHIAKKAVMHHNKMMADDALSHAETRMLNRAVPQGEIAADSDAGVSAIENARKAVGAGDTKSALSDINMAMGQSGGMSGDSGMGMSTATSTGGMAMPMTSKKPLPSLAHGITTSSDAGGPPSPGSTSDSGAVGGSGTIARSPDKPASSP